MEEYSICVPITNENLFFTISISILLHASKEKTHFYYTIFNTGEAEDKNQKPKKQNKVLSFAESKVKMHHFPVYWIFIAEARYPLTRTTFCPFQGRKSHGNIVASFIQGRKLVAVKGTVPNSIQSEHSPFCTAQNGIQLDTFHFHEVDSLSLL